NTGTDEHGIKIYRKAQEAGEDPQAYVDVNAKKFDQLKASLNLSYSAFIRTTDPGHKKAAQEFWKLCDQAGDIYKKNYSVKYCVGCELEKTESELAEGKCPLHPDAELETIEEENYFFRFSKYRDALLALYGSQKDFVLPSHRLNEIAAFAKRGFDDFSVSRRAEKMPWGVPVPGDAEHVMYVWFDALVNYISTLGWPDNQKNYKKFWPGVQVAGKDNLRQQAAMWQAMLLSAGLAHSKQILIHGFITSQGKKMSKSSGTVVDPFELVSEYGTDAVRYYLLAEIPPFEDGDFTMEKFEQLYNADLANGLGNVVSRVSNLLEKDSITLNLKAGSDKKLTTAVGAAMEEYRANEALELLWSRLRRVDEELAEKKPWEMESAEKKRQMLLPVSQQILDIALELTPFLPDTAQYIVDLFSQKQVTKAKPIFPRK
ncbi:MAG: methionine--tRNA ligase, partial [Patescibacteria group bacterium]|nr:methionine--tRNA ligase [Patescibacteria group bacterium]